MIYKRFDTNSSYMDFLLNTIQDISDLQYQQKVWVEASLPNVVDSWEETMCSFFADIDNFLDGLTPESNPEFGLSQHQIDLLRKLRDEADYYCSVTPKYMNPRDVISDPRWHKVVECAKETLKAFEGYQVPPPSSSEISQA